MAPQYKLTYFNITGLGEPIRYMLSYGNLPFEDNRIEMSDWSNWKSKTPYGQVPILEIDGKPHNQTLAICRYLAKQMGLSGKTDCDQLQADMMVDTITDFRLFFSAYFKEQNEEAKAKKLEDIKNIHCKFYLSKFEETVKQNGGNFVSGQLTWADVFFAAISEFMSNFLQMQILDGYPTLKALKEKVENIPGIKAYREKRPKTSF